MRKAKRFLGIILASLAAAFSSGCSEPAEKHIGNSERVQYEIEGETRELTVFDLYKGELYGIALDLAAQVTDSVEIGIYSDDGRKRGAVSVDGIDGSVTCIDILNGVIYLSAVITSNAGNVCRLYSVGTDGGTAKELLLFENASDVRKIRASEDGKIYFLAEKRSYEKYSETLYTENGETVDYNYRGEFFGCCGCGGEDYLESDIPYPAAFDERNGTVMVYAFEKGTGYYFRDYKSKTDSRTNKLKQIEDFELINDDMDYVFAGGTDYIGTLAISGITDGSGIIQVDDASYFSRCGSICAENDELCVNALNDPYDEYHTVVRYNTAAIGTKEPPVRIISSSYYKPLFSCGSQIKSERLSSEEFALSVLSLDPSYDLMIMSTREGYADNVRTKGSFYPLNDIPGVSEYIEGCFPSVRGTAVNPDGEIWMLPVSLDVCALVYNARNCAENGITFPTELSDFLPVIRGIDSEYFDCSAYLVTEAVFNSYLSANRRFDTESFRALAPLLKEVNADKAFKPNTNVNVSLALSSKLTDRKLGQSDPFTDRVYENALFTAILQSEFQSELAEDENLLAAPLPYASGAKPCSICSFICVNPNSEHPEETLSYVERLTSYLTRKKDGFVFDDREQFGETPLAQRLYEIYSDSEVYFQIPSEVYYADFMKYCSDEITLDAFITEAGRKLSAYLNE